jgi:hypothetical protein
MTEPTTQAERLDVWAVVELFGHARIAGKVTEQTLAGGAFLRVDVPETDGTPAFTRFFGAGAIYSISPCSEEVGRLVAKQVRAAPITVYVPELHRLLPPDDFDGDLDDLDDDLDTEKPL